MKCEEHMTDDLKAQREASITEFVRRGYSWECGHDNCTANVWNAAYNECEEHARERLGI